MLRVSWQGVKVNGDTSIETWSTTKDISIEFGATFLIVKTAIGGQLLLSVPAWRIIEVTTEREE